MRKVRALIALMICGWIAIPNAAIANQISSTVPTSNAVLTISPSQVTITGTVPLMDMGNQLTVAGPDGVRVDDGSLTVTDKSLTVGLKSLTASGLYTVSYELLGVNDVPLQGAYTFIFNAPAVIDNSTATPTPSESEEPVSSSKGADYFVIGLLIVAFIVLISIVRMARNTFRK